MKTMLTKYWNAAIAGNTAVAKSFHCQKPVHRPSRGTGLYRSQSGLTSLASDVPEKWLIAGV
jgi:hypothetical protein